MEKSKNILVICTSFDRIDFNEPLNQKLKLLLFGYNPIYVFCNGHSESELFPNCPNDDGTMKYDFIWFAGCNFIQDIFKTLTGIEKIKNILQPNGYIIFTESEYIKNGKSVLDEPDDDYGIDVSNAFTQYSHIYGHDTPLDSKKWNIISVFMFDMLPKQQTQGISDLERTEIISKLELNLPRWYSLYEAEQQLKLDNLRKEKEDFDSKNLTVTLENLISHSKYWKPHSYNTEIASSVKENLEQVDLSNNIIAYKINSERTGGNKKSKKNRKRTRKSLRYLL
jgi:hypothetical protein